MNSWIADGTKMYKRLIALFLSSVLISGGIYFYSNVVDISPFLALHDETPTKLESPFAENVDRQHEKNRAKLGAISKPIPQNGTDNYKVQKRRLPGCIIIGARKGGTRALLEYLMIHPRLAVCGKEMQFFHYDVRYNKGLDHYRQLMPLSYPDQITVEKSPMYFQSEKAPKRIHEFNESVKLIVTLRHPLKRLISDYHQRLREGKAPANLTLEQLAINNVTGAVNENYQPVKISQYYIHLRHWFQYFPQRQFHIVDGDNLLVNPIQELKKIETFLGIEHFITGEKVYFNKTKGFYCMKWADGPHCLQKDKGHVFEDIDSKLYQKLSDYFEPYNRGLFLLLGRTFEWK